MPAPRAPKGSHSPSSRRWPAVCRWSPRSPEDRKKSSRTMSTGCWSTRTPRSKSRGHCNASEQSRVRVSGSPRRAAKPSKQGSHSHTWCTAMISSTMSAFAPRRLPHVSFHQADVTSLPFDDASFDTVTCVGLLMHLDEATRLTALSELARVSRRFLVIQYGCVGPFLRFATGLTGREPGGVRHSVEEADMRRDLQRVGLRERGRFWALRPFSTSVVLLLSK